MTSITDLKVKTTLLPNTRTTFSYLEAALKDNLEEGEGECESEGKVNIDSLKSLSRI